MENIESRQSTVEEVIMDVDSIMDGIQNGSIVSSIGMDIHDVLDKFPGFQSLPFAEIVRKCDANLDFIWEWSDKVDQNGKFNSWNETYKRMPIV